MNPSGKKYLIVISVIGLFMALPAIRPLSIVSVDSGEYVIDRTLTDEYEPDDIKEFATIVNINDPNFQRHTFHSPGDSDWVKFVGVKGNAYRIRILDPGVDSDPVITLFDSDGSNVIESINRKPAGEAETLHWNQCPETGIYYICITNYHPNGSSEKTGYVLSVVHPYAPDLPGNLTGFVLDANTNQPIGDVAIIVGEHHSSLTRPGGVYYIMGIEPETYPMTAEKNGYFSYSGSVSIASLSTTVKDLYLEPYSVFNRLAVSVIGEGAVVSYPGNIDCNPECMDDFPDGSVVRLISTPDPGWRFERWENVDCKTNECTFVLSRNSAIAAVFTFQEIATCRLDVDISGNGRVTSDPEGIDCYGFCSAEFSEHSEILLSATPDEGWAFDGWAGHCTATSPCIVDMDDDRYIQASFSEKSVLLTIAVFGKGRVAGENIECNDECIYEIPYGAEITLTAEPGTGWMFSGWNDVSSESGDIQVPMTTDQMLTAVFELEPIASNTPPAPPVLASPLDNDTVTPPILLVTEPFDDPNTNDAHLETQWQIAVDIEFSSLVFDYISASELTEIVLPDTLLSDNSCYFWRVRFRDANGALSLWSETGIFATSSTERDEPEIPSPASESGGGCFIGSVD